MTKCASAAFVLALLVLSAGAQELLRDDFTHGLAKWLVADPALVRAADGGLRILPGGALAAGDATWRDYRVSFRARTVEQPRGDGHWGIHLRAVPGPPEGELYVFARPERIALAGSGKTEWGFTEAPPFDSTQEHLYQLTVADGQVEVAVDGRVLGVAHNIGNATGGVRLSAYNCAVEIRDVVIDALTPEAAPAEPAQPVDLAPGDLALDPAGLPDYVDVVVCNPTGVRRANEPVVLDLTTVSFPSTPNLSSLTATDAATCAALPTQVDDLLGTGRIPAKGTPEALYGPRLCVLVSLAPYAARTIRLRYATASGDYRRTASTGFATRLDGGSLTVTTAVYTARFNAKGGFTFQPAGFDRPFITTRDPDEETLICRRVGPVGAFLMSRYPVKDNGRVTRVIEAWPDRAKVTTVLAPADNRHDAFVGPVGGFWFDIPMDAVNELRYHTVDGFDEETPGAARPVERLYAAPNSPGLDFVLANTSVALVRRQRPDYTPGMGVIGWHHYASGGLAFGWRPPVQVTRDRPHVQELWLVPHPGEMDAFGEVDLACRRPVEVVVNAGRPPVGARYPRPSGGRPEGNAEAAARPTPLDYHDRARRRAAEMGDLEAAANLPGHTKLLFEAVRGARARFAAAAGVNGKLDDYLAGEALLGKLDLPAAARRIASTLGAASGAPARDHEVAPWRALVGQARTCAAAAAWDLAADHEHRGAQRLARAADLYARAKRYAARAPSRIAPAVPAGGLYPYVTFSEGAHAKLARVGFDVGHFWVPWGNHFEQLEVEPRPGQWDFSTTDQLFADAANSRMATIPLLNFAPPRWWQKQFEPARDAANAPPGSTGDARLVSPKLLGRVPPPKQAFGEYIRQMAGRYGKQPGLLAWSVRNEPAYYETGGINGPLMREAFDHWIGERYPTVAALNAVWGTEFADFGGLVPPRKWEDNRAAWYDLMTFKAECLNGELSWEADLAMESSPVRRSGAKFVPACSGPGAARSGYGVDPWLTAGAQRGVAFCDLYLDDARESALRAAELSWGAGGVPVISCETGPSSRPAGRAFRYHYLPDRRARSFAWMMLGYGLYGTHYWTWSTNDEYGCLDWDGTLCDYGLEAALANREMQGARPALAGLMPRVDLGFLYPRASFVQGERTVLEAYGRSYRALAEAGYQVRLVAPSDFDRAAPSLSHLFVPPAPYLESALVERLTRYVRAGGTLIVCGEPGGFDEYARPRPGGLRPLTGAASDAGHAVGKGRVYWLGWEGDAASAAVILPAALQRAGAPRSLSAAPAGISQRVLVGQKGERYLVVSNLSGAEKRWEVTVYGTAGARPAYVDLLTGERMTAKRAGGGLVVSLALEAEGARLVRLDAGR